MRNSTTYKLAGPKTFRRSSVKLIGGQGGNLQNVTKEMRQIYISDGYSDALAEKCVYWLTHDFDDSVFTEEELDTLRVMCQTDQSGAEALIVAYDSEPGDYRLLFIHGVKPHVYAALKLFREIWPGKAVEYGVRGITKEVIDELYDTPIPQLKNNPHWRELDALIKSSDDWPITQRYYYLAKQTVHSFSYDVQWSRFIMNILEKSGGKIVINREQGEYFLNTIRSLFPEVPERNRRIQRQVEQTHIIYNMFGFPFQITDYNQTRMKDCFAWGPQSTVGEITRIAISRMQEYIEDSGKKWDCLNDSHDSMLHQCPLRDVKECATKQKECMNIPLVSPIDGAKFNMKSECKIGFNWGVMKELPDGRIINPTGLRDFKV